MNSKKRLISLLSLLCILLSSCSFSTLHLTVTTTHQLNRDAVYSTLPVVVRIYTLKNPEGFSAATFQELWHNDKKILGDNLISREEFTVVPGKKLHLELTKQNNAYYIGAIALFRHPEHNKWHMVIPMPLFSASLYLSGNQIAFN